MLMLISIEFMFVTIILNYLLKKYHFKLSYEKEKKILNYRYYYKYIFYLYLYIFNILMIHPFITN